MFKKKRRKKKQCWKKNKGQNVFLKKKKKKKKTVFMINIHNLPQFVNHTVALVQNKNNNEWISLKWGVCA